MNTLVPPPIIAGPWIVGTPSTYATYNANKINSEKVGICEVYGIPLHSSLEEVEGDPKYQVGMAHARFIAASPQMAEALLDCHTAMVSMWTLLHKGECPQNDTIDAALSALLQAGYKETPADR